MKNKYDLFNKMSVDENNDKVHILSEEEKNTLFRNLSYKIDMNSRFKKNYYKKVAIVWILCLSISTIILSNKNVWAVVENIGRQIEHYFGKNDNEFKGYKVSVNKSVEDKGIKMTLYEVLLDDGQIILSMNMDHSNFDESILKKGLYKHKNYYLNEYSVYIDGRKFIQSGTGTNFEYEKNDRQDFLTTLSLDSIDTNNDGIADIDNYKLLDNIDPNKDYDVKIVYEEVGIQQVGLLSGAKYDNFTDIEGKWEFNVRVSGEKIMGETKTYNIDKDIEISDKEFKAFLHIDQLRISPISTKLIYTIKMGDKYEYLDRNVDIELQDQDGNFITEGSSGGGNAEETLMNMILEENQSDLEQMIDIEKLESIKIVPYQYNRANDNPKYDSKIKYENKAIIVDLK